MRCVLCLEMDIPAVAEYEGVAVCQLHANVIHLFLVARPNPVKSAPCLPAGRRDPKALYCPHCEAETKQVEVSAPVLAELGSPLQPAGAVIYVAFTCPKCRTIISCSVVSAKSPAAKVF